MNLTILSDFFSILKASGVYGNCIHSKSKKTIYYPPTGSIIYYTGLDEAQKLKGTNFNYVWLNEADEFTHEQFTQLYLRLRTPSLDGKRNRIYLDFNPSDAYTWIRLEIEDKGRATVIHSTYKDNPFLDADTVRKIEYLKDNDPSFWSIYGMGEYTSIKGLIYTNYNIIEELPTDINFTWIASGLDFGYNDPMAFETVAYHKEELYIDELVYSQGLINKDLMLQMQGLGYPKNREIIADSARADSIAEIRREGYRITGAKKGKGSIKDGIQLLQGYRLNITKRSTNIIKEVRAYKWKLDKTGEPTEEPIDKFNHALDGIRYVALAKLKLRTFGLKISKSR
jgi:phage terminase large subunit